MNKEQALKALESVTDPISGLNLVEAQRIDQLNIDGNNVNFHLVLPSLNHPQKDNLIFACMEVLQKEDSGVEVNVHVTTKAEQVKKQGSSQHSPSKISSPLHQEKGAWASQQ